jgi:hypothetical protein
MTDPRHRREAASHEPDQTAVFLPGVPALVAGPVTSEVVMELLGT